MHNKPTEKIIRKNGQLLVINLYLCLMERNINYNDGDILIKDSFGDIFLAGTIRTTMVSAVICTAGQVSFSLGGTTYTATANDIVILPPNLSIDDVALDDDFDGHIEAFWYGFKKLMENVNGLYRMNPSAFNQYCNDLAEDAKQATLEAGAASMDAHQVDEFCKAIEELEKE